MNTASHLVRSLSTCEFMWMIHSMCRQLCLLIGRVCAAACCFNVAIGWDTIKSCFEIACLDPSRCIEVMNMVVGRIILSIPYYVIVYAFLRGCGLKMEPRLYLCMQVWHLWCGCWLLARLLSFWRRLQCCSPRMHYIKAACRMRCWYWKRASKLSWYLYEFCVMMRCVLYIKRSCSIRTHGHTFL